MSEEPLHGRRVAADDPSPATAAEAGTAVPAPAEVERVLCFDAATGKNLFSNADGTESDYFRHFIGGSQYYLLRALPAVIAAQFSDLTIIRPFF